MQVQPQNSHREAPVEARMESFLGTGVGRRAEVGGKEGGRETGGPACMHGTLESITKTEAARKATGQPLGRAHEGLAIVRSTRRSVRTAALTLTDTEG